MNQSDAISRKTKRPWLVPAVVIGILVVAFGGLKLYEKNLAERFRSQLVENIPGLKTEVTVSLLSREVRLNNTEFVLNNLLPGLSPKYVVGETVMDGLDLTALVSGNLNAVNRVAARDIKISSLLFNGTLDEFVQEGLTGDLDEIARLWSAKAPLEDILKAAGTVHVDRYYFKNYVIRAKSLTGKREMVMAELELKDLSLTGMGRFTLNNLYFIEDGLEIFRLGNVSLDSLEFPGAPQWLIYFFQQMSGAGAKKPATGPLAIRGFTLKDFSSLKFNLDEFRLDLIRDDKDFYDVQASLSRLSIPPETFSGSGLGEVLAESYGKPLVLSGQTSFSLDRRPGPNRQYPYALDVRQFALTGDDLFHTEIRVKGALSAARDVLIKEGEVLTQDRGIMDLLFRPLLDDEEAAEILDKLRKGTQDPASLAYINNLEKFIMKGGGIRVSLSSPSGVDLATLGALAGTQGAKVNLKSEYIPAE